MSSQQSIPSLSQKQKKIVFSKNLENTQITSQNLEDHSQYQTININNKNQYEKLEEEETILFKSNVQSRQYESMRGKNAEESPMNFQELQQINFNNGYQNGSNNNSTLAQSQQQQSRNWAKLPIKKNFVNNQNSQFQNNVKILPSLKNSKSVSDFGGKPSNIAQTQNMGVTSTNINVMLRTGGNYQSSSVSQQQQPFRMQIRKQFDEERQKKMSGQMQALSNELLVKYFDTTNSHISRIPEFPTRFSAAPFIKYGPSQLQAQVKKQIQTSRQFSQTAVNSQQLIPKDIVLGNTLTQSLFNQTGLLATQSVLLNKAPPDFKDHKERGSNEYYLPRIKDGLPTTVKNLSFLRAQQSPKRKEAVQNEGKFQNTSRYIGRSVNTSISNLDKSKEVKNNNIPQNPHKQLMIVSNSPFKKKKKLLNPNTDLNTVAFFQTELLQQQAESKTSRHMYTHHTNQQHQQSDQAVNISSTTNTLMPPTLNLQQIPQSQFETHSQQDQTSTINTDMNILHTPMNLQHQYQTQTFTKDVLNQSQYLQQQQQQNYISIEKIQQMTHRLPAELNTVTSKGYESARKYEKKQSKQIHQQNTNTGIGNSQLLNQIAQLESQLQHQQDQQELTGKQSQNLQNQSQYNNRRALNVSQSVDSIQKDNYDKQMYLDSLKNMMIQNDNLNNQSYEQEDAQGLHLSALQLTQNQLGPKNQQILDKNNQKSRRDLINSIRRFDDRTISYDKAKTKLWDMTKNYLFQHFQKQSNSREHVFPQYNKRGDLVNRDSLIDISFRSVVSRQFIY